MGAGGRRRPLATRRDAVGGGDDLPGLGDRDAGDGDTIDLDALDLNGDGGHGAVGDQGAEAGDIPVGVPSSSTPR